MFFEDPPGGPVAGSGLSGQLTNAWLPPGPAMLFCPADRPER